MSNGRTGLIQTINGFLGRINSPTSNGTQINPHGKRASPSSYEPSQKPLVDPTVSQSVSVVGRLSPSSDKQLKENNSIFNRYLNLVSDTTRNMSGPSDNRRSRELEWFIKATGQARQKMSSRVDLGPDEIQLLYDTIKYFLGSNEYAEIFLTEDGGFSGLAYRDAQDRNASTGTLTSGELNDTQMGAFLKWFNQDEFIECRRLIAEFAEYAGSIDTANAIMRDMGTPALIKGRPRSLYVWDKMHPRKIGTESQDVDIMVTSNAGSGELAQVIMEDEQWYIRASDIPNAVSYFVGGTWVSLPTRSKMKLEENALVQIGNSVFSVEAIPQLWPRRKDSKGAPKIKADPRKQFTEMVNRTFRTHFNWDSPKSRKKILGRLLSISKSHNIGVRMLRSHSYFRQAIIELYDRIVEDIELGVLPYHPKYARIPEAYVVPDKLDKILNYLLAADSRLDELPSAGGRSEPQTQTTGITQHIMFKGAIGHLRGKSIIVDRRVQDSFAEQVGRHAIEIEHADNKQLIISEHWVQNGTGVKGWSQSPEGRIYFAVKHKHAKEFWSEICRRVEESCSDIPVAWKLSRIIQRYTAGDTAVLYFRASDSERIYELITDLYKTHGHFFRDTTPLLAAKLKDKSGEWMTGISFGQSPTYKGESFNGEVAEIATEARRGARLREKVMAIKGEPTQDNGARKAEIKRAIAYAWECSGISPDHPAFKGKTGLEAFRFIADKSNQP
jgi:hypothetical protein